MSSMNKYIRLPLNENEYIAFKNKFVKQLYKKSQSHNIKIEFVKNISELGTKNLLLRRRL